VCGRAVPHEPACRRPGDPPVLIGDASRAPALLGWRPARSDLTMQIEDAWKWMQARQLGAAMFRQNLPEPRAAGSTQFSDKPNEFTCFEDPISLFSIIKFPVIEKQEISAKSLEALHHSSG
jgi:hypothetical protein